MAAAIRYTIGTWRAHNWFVDDGRIEVHKNAAERALRAVAIGRKNYLHLDPRAVAAARDTASEQRLVHLTARAKSCPCV
jgi:hypothetical protein